STPGSVGSLAGGGAAWAGMSKSDHSSSLPGQEGVARLNGTPEGAPAVTENWCSRRLGCQGSAGGVGGRAEESNSLTQSLAASITAWLSPLATPSALGTVPVAA